MDTGIRVMSTFITAIPPPMQNAQPIRTPMHDAEKDYESPGHVDVVLAHPVNRFARSDT